MYIYINIDIYLLFILSFGHFWANIDFCVGPTKFERWANAILLIGATLGQRLARRLANDKFPDVFVGPSLAETKGFLGY